MDANTIGKLSKEIAWVTTNAIIDSSDEDIGKLEIRALVKIRDIIEMETDTLLHDMIKKNKDILEILNRV